MKNYCLLGLKISVVGLLILQGYTKVQAQSLQRRPPAAYVSAADAIDSPAIRNGIVPRIQISLKFDANQRILLAQAAHWLNIYLTNKYIYPQIKSCAVKYATDRESLNTSRPYSRTIYSRLGNNNISSYLTSSTFKSRAYEAQQKFSREEAVYSLLENYIVLGATADIYIEPFSESRSQSGSIAMAQVRNLASIEWRPVNGFNRSKLVMYANTVALNEDLSNVNEESYTRYRKTMRWTETIFHEMLHLISYRHADGDVPLNDYAAVRGNSVYEISRCLNRLGQDRKPGDSFLLPDEFLRHID